MSNIDKQALLKIAESVDREEWDVLDNGDDEYQVIVSGSLERGATYRSYRPVANEIPEQEIAAFIAAANPATVLALLDENIQLLREKDAIEAVALALRDDMRDAREQLADAGRLIADLDKRLIEYAGIATREAHRVAELEARTVSIPEVRITVAESKRKNLTWRELGAYNEGADVAKEKILAAIRAAGIKVKGE
ncbi:ead/Ea22-like family protein [Salmonella enterica subsp. enterica serovar Hillingdon]|nr:ead/Ea22-like family protein [Salmonella enterica subsp. enterica serovar Hillingdon]EDR9797602.1 ead/Ea22-like family protein [Salmonella enterica subsp. enterica serovar Zongo]EKY4319675.1 ead/Ea22-like family protein [Salmonella enterica]EDR0865872.1 ead/Ea22-like family protein [Salmonella enterica subsp. enterica serovar Hillingdon]EDR6330487.1 ead/Ea22-like family protein [Salmonella enterica subsp. enterica serovar Hillingdon]